MTLTADDFTEQEGEATGIRGLTPTLIKTTWFLLCYRGRRGRRRRIDQEKTGSGFGDSVSAGFQSWSQSTTEEGGVGEVKTFRNQIKGEGGGASRPLRGGGGGEGGV